MMCTLNCLFYIQVVWACRYPTPERLDSLKEKDFLFALDFFLHCFPFHLSQSPLDVFAASFLCAKKQRCRGSNAALWPPKQWLHLSAWLCWEQLVALSRPGTSSRSRVGCGVEWSCWRCFANGRHWQTQKTWFWTWRRMCAFLGLDLVGIWFPISIKANGFCVPSTLSFGNLSL